LHRRCPEKLFSIAYRGAELKFPLRVCGLAASPGPGAMPGSANFAAGTGERSFRVGADSIMHKRFAPDGNASRRNEGLASILP
jgi:hypothetical protein